MASHQLWESVGGYDQSRMFGWPKPWAEGAMTWRIPIAWRSKHRSNGGERRLSFDYNSEWTMTGDSIIKTKHGQVLTLSEGRQVFLNGEHCAGGSEND